LTTQKVSGLSTGQLKRFRKEGKTRTRTETR